MPSEISKVLGSDEVSESEKLVQPVKRHKAKNELKNLFTISPHYRTKDGAE